MSPTIDPVLLAALTDNGDDTPALSVFSDAARELEALHALLCHPSDAHLERDAMLVLLGGLVRRFTAAGELLRRERLASSGAASPKAGES